MLNLKLGCVSYMVLSAFALKSCCLRIKIVLCLSHVDFGARVANYERVYGRSVELPATPYHRVHRAPYTGSQAPSGARVANYERVYGRSVVPPVTPYHSVHGTPDDTLPQVP